jgi:hypothetical protein
MSSSEFFETAAKFAPLVTATIALGAALIALHAIGVQRDVARRRAAIDFFLKTEMDKTIVDLYEKFRQVAPTIKSLPSISDFAKSGDYRDIRAFLNICELIAVGINQNAFSERVSFNYWGDVLPNSYRDAKSLIEYIRSTPGEGSAETYADLEKICKKWATR